MSIQPVQGQVVPHAAPVQKSSGADGLLTPEEKQFFEKLYPEAVPEIRSYPTYGRRGVSSEPRLGSMIDRKG